MTSDTPRYVWEHGLVKERQGNLDLHMPRKGAGLLYHESQIKMELGLKCET